MDRDYFLLSPFHTGAHERLARPRTKIATGYIPSMERCPGTLPYYNRMNNISARLLTKEQAAEYCGAKSLRTFDRWRTKNLVPGPIPHLGRWDRKVLDHHIDKLSGLIELVEPKMMNSRNGVSKMALMIDLEKQGIHRVTSKGKEYHYAWRGGPRLKSSPGTLAYVQEFLSHKKAKDAAKQPTKNFAWVIGKFKETTEFTSLAERTKKDYLSKIEKIEKKFASLPLSAFNATNEKKTRGWFKGWRDDLAKTSLKQADYHWAVLARICSVAAERGWINVNPCTKGGRVYTSNRQELIWLTEDEEKFYAGAPHHMSLAVLLAVWTGQRQGDLLRMCWSKGRMASPISMATTCT